MKGRSLLALAVLASAALADDAESRRDRIRASLADSDPSVRAKGREAFDAFADERLDLARSLTKDKDPEVAVAAKEVLFEKCIFREDVDAKRFGEILQSMSDPSRDATRRKELFRKFLSLGPEAAAFLAAELKETKATIDLDLSPMRLGDRREIDVLVKNGGSQAFWYDPEGYVVDLSFEKFDTFRCIGCRLGRRVVRSSSDESSRVLDGLSRLRRVPPGASFSMGLFTAEPTCCGEFQVVLRLKDKENTRAVFSGQEIPLRPPELALERSSFAAMGTRELEGFTAEILPRGPEGRPAIRVTAETDAGEAPGIGDGGWWAATDADGQLIAHGLIHDDDVVVLMEAWKLHETRTEELDRDPPPGTKKLWLGFNAGGDQQAVPEPLPWPLEPEAPK